MEKIKEEVPEKLRIAVLLSFISGYINAFTYNNAGELFAGAQTGNVIFIQSQRKKLKRCWNIFIK